VDCYIKEKKTRKYPNYVFQKTDICIEKKQHQQTNKQTNSKQTVSNLQFVHVGEVQFEVTIIHLKNSRKGFVGIPKEFKQHPNMTHTQSITEVKTGRGSLARPLPIGASTLRGIFTFSLSSFY
jgi:hypothetical protein